MSRPDPIHDLKNQLGIVLGFAEMLLEEEQHSDRARADLREIRQAAERALELLPAIAARLERDA
jgi:signal transduction histidine kinase